MGADKSTPGTAYLEAQFWSDSKSENLKSVVPQVRSLNNLYYVNYAPNMLDDSTIPDLIITKRLTMLLPVKPLQFLC
jgi:hypothetical protein